MIALRAKDLKLDELVELVNGWGKRGRVWLETSDAWSLAYWQGLTEMLPSCGAGRTPTLDQAEMLVRRSVAGRLFDTTGELRWRKLPALGESAWRTVYLGEDLESISTLENRNELDGLSPRKSEHPLWGILTDAGRRQRNELDEWVELRIPHRFRYPVELPTSRFPVLAVKAIVEIWRNDRGDSHFVRLCDLQAYPVGE